MGLAVNGAKLEVNSSFRSLNYGCSGGRGVGYGFFTLNCEVTHCATLPSLAGPELRKRKRWKEKFNSGARYSGLRAPALTTTICRAMLGFGG
jgi:hypothetical protein